MVKKVKASGKSRSASISGKTDKRADATTSHQLEKVSRDGGVEAGTSDRPIRVYADGMHAPHGSSGMRPPFGSENVGLPCRHLRLVPLWPRQGP